MSLFYPAVEIPLLCFGVVLWILCYQFVKKKRKSTGNRSLSLPEPPSVYVVPVSEGEEPQLEPYEAHLQPPHRDPPVYSTIHVSLPPPYKLEPPAYQEPSYTDPPAYSEQT
ncbi:early nodulin-75-like [Takifugu rubripes]|uniref:early nodulin-75-like n=1 Tax=Takifugu rubripes TaxID=31033 RepID=UPI0005D29D66|nr:early nodulin-75-like [Takifugu rubripes]XP_029700844.1 early nodulin-75-like [Takifugu rubripes]|eukprot:XP_011602418.1 PREDICTED: early nodulin-75-like [Takifugu rubripes]